MKQPTSYLNLNAKVGDPDAVKTADQLIAEYRQNAEALAAERNELLAIRDELLHHLEAVTWGIAAWLGSAGLWGDSEHIDLFTHPANEAEDAVHKVRARIDECADGWVPPERPWGSRRRA